MHSWNFKLTRNGLKAVELLAEKLEEIIITFDFFWNILFPFFADHNVK